ncbi:MAG: FAD-binding oxidoreductase [Chloroflexota bacterium]
MNVQITSTPDETVAELRSVLRGTVVAPGDAEYEDARQVMPGNVDLRPAAIARVADAGDIAAVIAVARRTGLELAVRSGGHSTAGHSSTDGGLVIDLRGMNAIDIDVEDRSVWVETGVTALELTQAVGEHGLAIGFGDTGSVGIGGITLGGGVGYLVRKHGLTIDSLLAADVVTADGELLRVDEASHPDLFWAIRGGGGNFGVATRFRFRLHELPSIVGGILILPATQETIAGFIAASEAAPDELSGIANVMPAPPMPFLPEQIVGKVVIFALMAWAGDDEAGERALAPFRALATPLADMLRPMAYAEMYFPEDDSYHPKAVSRTMFMDRVDVDDARTMLEHLEASDASLRAVQLRVLGGAMARVPADATAFAHRSSRIMTNVAAFYDGPDDKPVREAWVAELSAALHQGDAGAYVNFLLDEGDARVRAAYPNGIWDRLVEIKRRYDPDNVFRRNQNIAPG